MSLAERRQELLQKADNRVAETKRKYREVALAIATEITGALESRIEKGGREIAVVADYEYRSLGRNLLKWAWIESPADEISAADMKLVWEVVFNELSTARFKVRDVILYGGPPGMIYNGRYGSFATRVYGSYDMMRSVGVGD